jgi:membrane-associated phospholipid phosphatase
MIAVARWLSIVGHPLVTSVVLVSAVAFHLNGSRHDALRSVLLVAAISLLPVAVLIIWQVRRGTWTNVDASNREERPILFAVGIVSLLLLVIVLFFAQPTSFLLRGALGVAAMLTVAAIATRWVKVSLHTAFCALAATLLLLLHAPAGWVLVSLLPLVAWSRLVLHRHTAIEVAAGLALGLVFGITIFSL